jgi:beta-galactosidase/beta-glucuronidase|tara:strand:+ start:1513 stop:1824 length:312 start_codon:yes stop_codon:yes gene_type:complete
MSKKYINVFINDRKYPTSTETFYNELQKNASETQSGNPPPYLSNKDYVPREDIILKAGQHYDVTLWFNEKDGKKSSSICIKPAEPKQESNPSPADVVDDDLPW